MRRLGLLACCTILFGSGAASLYSADPSERTTRSAPGSTPENTLFGKLFGKKKEAPPPPGPRVSPREQAAKTIVIEQKAHLQRLAVCTRLREIAEETGNDALNKQADQLEKKSYEVYTQRIAHLPGARDSESVLDRELGNGVATTPVDADAKNGNKNVKSSARNTSKTKKEDAP